MRPASVARWDFLPAAAGGRYRQAENTAAVEKPEDQRKPERLFGNRKVDPSRNEGESLIACQKNLSPLSDGFFCYVL